MLSRVPGMTGAMVSGVRNLAHMTDEALLRFGIEVQNTLQDVAVAINPKNAARAGLLALTLAACAPQAREPQPIGTVESKAAGHSEHFLG